MALTIPVAHDFICPWCWVGLIQARRLELEFGIQTDWQGHELFPVELEWPDPAPSVDPPANKPPTPSRFDFILYADNLELPKSERPKKMRTFNAHQAVEYARTEGVHNQLVEALYRAYWERGEEINDMAVLRNIAKPIIKDIDALQEAVETKKFKNKIVGFDDEAYSKGVYNVPTFFIGGNRYAEQPYSVLRKAIKEAL